MSETFDYNPSRSLPARIARRLTQWRVADPVAKQPNRPIVSFTFDDFPKSAADIGAQIIQDAGGRATYYACTSFMNKTTSTGEQFGRAEIEALTKAGHEIGAHSHTHLDCSKAQVNQVRSDIQVNLAHLNDLGVKDIQSFAYPYGETQHALKHALKSEFLTARGVLAGENTPRADRMQLRALEISGQDWTVQRARKAIDAAKTSPAWIVIFTHDVTTSPSDYGTTPQALKDLAQAAQDIGAEIITMKNAAKHLGIKTNA